jgi:deoxyribodipyrimidine photo-lyase
MSLDFFPVAYAEILRLVQRINPTDYAKSRNFSNGAVTRLSPYISRGVISLPEIFSTLQQRGINVNKAEKFIQELAWREYFQRVWFNLGDAIFSDLKNQQVPVDHHQVPIALIKAQTGINAVDEAIENFYTTGYLHNHMRMYIAGITCNLGKAHWAAPAAWMYYHLLDGDLASNNCSWQWIAGSFSSKKYIANQENINRYFNSGQQNTYLDTSYEKIFDQPVPAQFKATVPASFNTPLPASSTIVIDPELPVLLYNSYQLNVNWRRAEKANRILLLEPSHFSRFPVSERVISFVVQLAKENIPGIQVACMELQELPGIQQIKKVHSIEHPLTKHYPGEQDPYPWLIPAVSGYYPSFSAYWKKAAVHLYASSRNFQLPLFL